MGNGHTVLRAIVVTCQSQGIDTDSVVEDKDGNVIVTIRNEAHKQELLNALARKKYLRVFGHPGAVSVRMHEKLAG